VLCPGGGGYVNRQTPLYKYVWGGIRYFIRDKCIFTIHLLSSLRRRPFIGPCVKMRTDLFTGAETSELRDLLAGARVDDHNADVILAKAAESPWGPGRHSDNSGGAG
jgi:hypothetical protein